MQNKSITLLEIEDAWVQLKAAYGVEIAVKYLKENPDNHRAMLFLSYFYVHLRKFGEALSIIKKVIRLHQKDKGELAKAYIAMGFLYQEKGNYKVAERWYRKALKMGPDNPAHYQYVGEALSLQGDFSEAEKYFNAVLNMETTAVKEQAYYELGFIRKTQGKYKEALFLYDKAAELGVDKECVDEERVDVKDAIKVTERAGNRK